MIKFHYPFQKILDLKGNEKTQAEWMLSAAVGALEAEEQGLRRLEAEKSRTLEAVQRLSAESSSVVKLQEMQEYLSHLNLCIEKKIKEVQSARTNVSKKQQHLTEKMLDEKVWLKAKERAQEQFRGQMLRVEQHELDEIATVRFSLTNR
ncbi:hypothetical protein PAE9249_02318 [Paenibacillus sp. CECT 9249]|nr:flagellar export protein FliJ [Paenibacillus sp. MSJ-34]CAH0119810.1 hypothetical protein PAE9249_02318 [Paenibacillus sp. CECT 9249]